MQGEQYSQAQLDALARERGFQNYEQYVAWDRNTRQAVMGANPQTEAPKNWLQNLFAKIPGHPAQTLGYVNDRMRKALGRE
jgi:hypothetical protein